MPEQVKKVGKYTVAIGKGKSKQGEKNALSPIYRCVTALLGSVKLSVLFAMPA